MRKRRALLALASVAAGLLAMGTAAAAAAPAAENIAYYAIYVDPILQWDPSGSVTNEVMVFNNIYETLLRYNPESDEFTGVLATDYSVSDDGLTWTFNIRENVTFHDGTPLNAEAVKFCIDRTINNGQMQSYLWEPVESIEVVDEYTVQFNLNTAAPLDVIAAATSGAYIYSPTAVEENGEEWFAAGNECGSGPYMLNSYSMGENVILSAYEDYWGGWEENQYGTVIIEKAAEASSRRQLVESGEANITHMLTNEDLEALKAVDTVEVVEAPTIKNINLLYNTAEGPTSDENFRKALAYAIPYEDILESACGGYASKATGYVPAGLWGHSDDIMSYSYDLDKAQEYLDASEYADEDVTLVMTYQTGDETLRLISELYQTELEKLGITLDIRAVTWDSQFSMATSTDPADRQDILLEYWMLDIASPYSFVHGMYGSEPEDAISNNLSYYRNSELDALLEEANQLAATDREAASEKFVEAQNMIAEDAPGIAVCDKTEVFAITNMGEVEMNAAYPMVIRFYDCTVAE
ncbi:MAG TPA: ABC transporter substrate-binding protein [Candidatus Choladousia intestinipullorum]|nr:ABC transporter substrate-binding protein [Candidatus Choladousia intestinipullorum]